MIDRTHGVLAWASLPALLLASTASAATCPGYSVCPIVNYPTLVVTNAQVQAELAAIDAQETSTLAALKAASLTPRQTLALIGEALVFDKSLSANSNEACALCHVPTAGFSGGVKAFVPDGGIFPGSVTYRAGNRTPQSLAYAAFAPPLTLAPPPAAFVGGNFWDSRATGAITGIPAADQVAGPLTNPLEMALPDPACAVYRVAISPVAGEFAKAWGAASLAITWPADTATVCRTANNGSANQTPLALSTADRAQATATLENIGRTIATYEASTLASPFSSKFDAVVAGKASFTAAEQAGFNLFNGPGHCAGCHQPGGPVAVFTGWQSFNTGIPHNTRNPYLTENKADPAGYVANSEGTAYVDPGLGGFLASSANTNATWKALAPQFLGTFQVPTLRNVAMQPTTGANRTYMHNGYFNNLATIVHFYNTRDVLPRCTGTTGIGVTCWPAPETAANETHIIGNLGLTHTQELEIVAFLETLSDGYIK
jgi:cytochrome c peroxidase